jgi:hypothetical protein
VAKQAAASIDELVKQTLLKIVEADGPLRLTGSGKGPPALLSGTAKTTKEAIARIRDADEPLVVESGTGGNARLTLTAAGFARIADVIPEEKIGAAAKALADC